MPRQAIPLTDYKSPPTDRQGLYPGVMHGDSMLRRLKHRYADREDHTSIPESAWKARQRCADAREQPGKIESTYLSATA